MSALAFDSALRFSCQSCTRCCHGPRRVTLAEEELPALKDALRAQGLQVEEVLQARAGRQVLRQEGASRRCVLLSREGQCSLWLESGLSAMPRACRRFPYTSVHGTSQVWASLDFSCSAVQEHQGRPLQEQRAELEQQLQGAISSTEIAARVSYPLRSGLSCEASELEAWVEQRISAMGSRLFPALKSLARWVDSEADGGEPGGPQRKPERVLDLPDTTRHAFICLLEEDMPRPSGWWDRIAFRLALPKRLALIEVYTSQTLQQFVALGNAWNHPGQLPPAAERLLLRFLIAQLRGRSFLQGCDHAAAGVTLLLLWVNVVLCLSRALAEDRAILLSDVQQALRAVEACLRPAAQARLAEDQDFHTWLGDPVTARGAASMYEPRASAPS